MAQQQDGTETAKPAPGAAARQLVRGQDRAGLATIMPDTGAPYASLVIFCCDYAGRPYFLLSDLAQHTMNIAENPSVSLLVDGVAGLEDPLTGRRVTLMGRVERFDPPDGGARFISRHPSSELYAGFGDFNWYGFLPERCHMVAGFGAIDWIEPGDYQFDAANASDLATAEQDIVDHMNGDHADTVQLFAARLLGLYGTGWRMTGIDPEGCDLRRGGDVARLAFSAPVRDAESARQALLSLAAKSRAGDA